MQRSVRHEASSGYNTTHMRKHVPLPTLFLLALSLPFFEVQAQCPFDPTVLPPDLILCPNEQAVLATQVYDSYQWYKDGAPVFNASSSRSR